MHLSCRRKGQHLDLILYCILSEEIAARGRINDYHMLVNALIELFLWTIEDVEKYGLLC